MNTTRNKKINMNDDLLRKIVYSIEKAIGEDMQHYLRENRRETNNAIILLRGDFVNTNLREHIVNDEVELVPFQRNGWCGRIVIDRKNHITYSIMTEATLSGIPRKKNRENPHYLHSILYVENRECVAKERQMTLDDFGITTFDAEILEGDFAKISQGLINMEKAYKHYIVSYKAEHGEITSISLKFLDKDFNIVDEESLMQFIKPDFARLTDIEDLDENNEERKEDKKSLVAVKNGIKRNEKKVIKSKLRKIEKEV